MKKGSPRDYEPVGYVPSVNGFGANLAVGKYSLNLLQTVVPGRSGEQVRSH